MPLTLRLLWSCWVVLTLLLVVGLVGLWLSTKLLTTPLQLSVGRKIRLSAFRPVRDRLRIALNFSRAANVERKELGDWKPETSDERLVFENPGSGVTLRVDGPGGDVLYEAYPAHASSLAKVTRNCFVVTPHPRGDYPWPPSATLPSVLEVGRNELVITVVSVEAPIVGENVTLIITPPLSFKSSHAGYGFLWWFYFWPLYAVVLLLGGGLLFWKSFYAGRS